MNITENLISSTITDDLPHENAQCAFCEHDSMAVGILRRVYEGDQTPWFMNACAAHLISEQSKPVDVDAITESGMVDDGQMIPRLVIRDDEDAAILLDALSILGDHLISRAQHNVMHHDAEPRKTLLAATRAVSKILSLTDAIGDAMSANIAADVPTDPKG